MNILYIQILYIYTFLAFTLVWLVTQLILVQLGDSKVPVSLDKEFFNPGLEITLVVPRALEVRDRQLCSSTRLDDSGSGRGGALSVHRHQAEAWMWAARLVLCALSGPGSPKITQLSD